MGWGAQYYTHFTSPIRRYPDTTVHRLIKWYKENGTTEEAKAKYRDRLAEIAEHTSVTERRGIDTERDVDSMKKAEFMEDHVGETFDAVVSSVMKFGLFVALENTVEGLIHISVMNDDYYEYIEKHMALVGRDHHHIFQIGQPVKVKLLRVDKDQREVDFELVNADEAPLTKLRAPRQNDRRNGRGRGNGNGRRNKTGAVTSPMTTIVITGVVTPPRSTGGKLVTVATGIIMATAIVAATVTDKTAATRLQRREQNGEKRTTRGSTPT